MNACRRNVCRLSSVGTTRSQLPPRSLANIMRQPNMIPLSLCSRLRTVGTRSSPLSARPSHHPPHMKRAEEVELGIGEFLSDHFFDGAEAVDVFGVGEDFAQFVDFRFG